MATTRRQTRKSLESFQIHNDGKKVAGKRPADASPTEQQQPKKRTAFLDLTNANANNNKLAVLKDKKEAVKKQTKKKQTKKSNNKSGSSQLTCSQSSGIIELSQSDSQSSQSSVSDLSQGSTQSQDILSSSQSDSAVESLNLLNSRLSQQSNEEEKDKEHIEDIDAPSLGDVCQVSLYAREIFEYYKKREEKFVIGDYLSWQSDLTQNMRSILVDWLVEVQENFELNHETLYLAIKLVDHYLALQKVSREKLQLVGAASLFISCKFDERCPPVLDDFLYICDDAYTREQLLRLEQVILKSINFDLGIPLSYRFLRRYSKCAKASMELLTLSRYILEVSQMDYTYVTVRDSKVAAACLYLAMKMKKVGEWSATLVHYTGYKEEDLKSLARSLNSMISKQPSKQLQTIYSKYSHKVFHEVAKIPCLDDLEFLS